MENNQPKTPISDEEQNKLSAAEARAAEELKLKMDSFAKHLDLDTYAAETKFHEIVYAGKNVKGRTVIALGSFAMHIRSAGHKKGKFENKKLNIWEEGEQSYDVLMIRLRHDISGIDLVRRAAEENEIQSLEEDQAPNEFLACHLVIYFRSGGSFEMNGLTEKLALHIRKSIYGWISHLY